MKPALGDVLICCCWRTTARLTENANAPGSSSQIALRSPDAARRQRGQRGAFAFIARGLVGVSAAHRAEAAGSWGAAGRRARAAGGRLLRSRHAGQVFG